MPAPLILTIRLDPESQAFFNAQRRLYFPPERNFLDAHLTLFHHLPDDPETIGQIESLRERPWLLEVTGLRNLGAGVAYEIQSARLQDLHKRLAHFFSKKLNAQDRQGFRPHITIMNKATPAAARTLLSELAQNFEPFEVNANGLDLWIYLGGPWQHRQGVSFPPAE